MVTRSQYDSGGTINRRLGGEQGTAGREATPTTVTYSSVDVTIDAACMPRLYDIILRLWMRHPQ